MIEDRPKPIRIALPLFHWVPSILEAQPRTRRYVAPFLVTLSIIRLRLMGRRAGWYFTGEDMTRALERSKKGHMWEVPCAFPHGWIRAECNFWNWRLRLLCRLGLVRK